MKTTARFAVAGLVWLGMHAASAQVPKVHLTYGYLPFDRNCERWTNQRIIRGWYDELEKLRPTLEADWAEEGPVLLGEAVTALNVPFSRIEVTAFLTLCDVQSMSLPLVINARQFLAASARGAARPLADFSPLLFHELLHTHLLPLYRQSELLRKYASEEPVVRTHLHLFAVMKHVFLRLGREEQLAGIIVRDSASSDRAYARAWEIVNSVEGHEPFVAELRSK